MNDFLPIWAMNASFFIPSIIVWYLLFAFVGCAIHSGIVLKKTNVFVNMFEDVTQMHNTQALQSMCISVLVIIAALLTGIPPTHAVMGLWYFVMNMCAVLYIIFLVDYFVLKYKKLI